MFAVLLLPTSAAGSQFLNGPPALHVEVSPEAKMDKGTTEISVLVAYSDRALLKYGESGAHQLATLFMSQARGEYIDSNTGVLLETLHIAHVSGVDGNDANVGYDPVLRALRIKHRADIGILIDTDLNGACGFAQNYSGTPDSWLGVVDDLCPQSTSHEIGHLLGAHHGPLDPSSSPPAQCYQALYNGSAEGFGTIMCGPMDNPGFAWEKVRRFSDPTKSLPSGEALGEIDCDNVSIIKTTKNVVAKFSEQLPVSLHDGRFLLEVTWQDFDGNTGVGAVAITGEGGATQSDDSVVLYFFKETNWEFMLKVLDACTFNDRFWVFWAATTNVKFTATITDTEAGTTKVYENPLGNRPTSVTDTDAFATCP